MSIGEAYDKIAGKWVALLDRKPTTIFLALSIGTIIWQTRNAEIRELQHRQDLKDAATILAQERAAHEITRHERDEALKEQVLSYRQTIQVLQYGRVKDTAH